MIHPLDHLAHHETGKWMAGGDKCVEVAARYPRSARHMEQLGVAVVYERFGDAALTGRAHRSQFGGCAAAVKVRIRMLV